MQPVWYSTYRILDFRGATCEKRGHPTVFQQGPPPSRSGVHMGISRLKINGLSCHKQELELRPGCGVLKRTDSPEDHPTRQRVGGTACGQEGRLQACSMRRRRSVASSNEAREARTESCLREVDSRGGDSQPIQPWQGACPGSRYGGIRAGFGSWQRGVWVYGQLQRKRHRIRAPGNPSQRGKTWRRQGQHVRKPRPRDIGFCNW